MALQYEHIRATHGFGVAYVHLAIGEIICRGYGMRTGLYTSPHLEHVNERIAIDGHIAFGLGANSVRSVMVNGVMIYEDRQFSFDCEPIFREAQKVAKKMWARMDALPA